MCKPTEPTPYPLYLSPAIFSLSQLQQLPGPRKLQNAPTSVRAVTSFPLERLEKSLKYISRAVKNNAAATKTNKTRTCKLELYRRAVLENAQLAESIRSVASDLLRLSNGTGGTYAYTRAA